MIVTGRRTALRALFTLTVAAFTGGTLAPIVTRPRRRHEALRQDEGDAFDEMYRGRRIRATRRLYGGGLDVRVDGRRLHLMRCADGGYLSPVDHYSGYPTPLAATRAAVDELGSARLSEGGSHGVHA
ncbi:tyrosinase family oxidase copper chaperone [Streptomyces sp. NPDC006368]|uniref:tyrosinase family oxidase copper chaperone n=1 Tax=Streptomyces sp. NPDC006368 TaxID=3156760 RepID=UPI0033B1FDF2